MIILSAGEKRAEQAARSTIRAAMEPAFGTKLAYACNLYHRPNGWYYQPHGDEPEHLGATIIEVATTLRDLARAERDADRYDNWH